MKYPTHTHTHTLMQKQKDDSILSWCLICYRYYYFDRGRGLEVCLLDHKYVYGLWLEIIIINNNKKGEEEARSVKEPQWH